MVCGQKLAAMTGNIQDGQERFMVIIRNRYFGAESPIRYQYAGFLLPAAKQRLVKVSGIAYFDEGHKPATVEPGEILQHPGTSSGKKCQTVKIDVN